MLNDRTVTFEKVENGYVVTTNNGGGMISRYVATTWQAAVARAAQFYGEEDSRG